MNVLRVFAIMCMIVGSFLFGQYMFVSGQRSEISGAADVIEMDPAVIAPSITNVVHLPSLDMPTVRERELHPDPISIKAPSGAAFIAKCYAGCVANYGDSFALGWGKCSMPDAIATEKGGKCWFFSWMNTDSAVFIAFSGITREPAMNTIKQLTDSAGRNFEADWHTPLVLTTNEGSFVWADNATVVMFGADMSPNGDGMRDLDVGLAKLKEAGAITDFRVEEYF